MADIDTDEGNAYDLSEEFYFTICRDRIADTTANIESSGWIDVTIGDWSDAVTLSDICGDLEIDVQEVQVTASPNHIAEVAQNEGFDAALIVALWRDLDDEKTSDVLAALKLKKKGAKSKKKDKSKTRQVCEGSIPSNTPENVRELSGLATFLRPGPAALLDALLNLLPDPLA